MTSNVKNVSVRMTLAAVGITELCFLSVGPVNEVRMARNHNDAFRYQYSNTHIYKETICHQK